jgi:16S rRNA (uracil1498-N3)-methyltransferase
MMSERFYVNTPLACGPLDLHGREAHHLAHVCRIRPGDQVYLFNGDGRQYTATVCAVSRQSVSLDVVSRESPQRELGFVLQVAAPLPKGDRAQFLIEKLTELGVTKFVPLRTRRSIVHPGNGKLEKLERYVIEASKQCGRNSLLAIEPVTDWQTFCRQTVLPHKKLLAHPTGRPLTPVKQEDMALVVGPEGGFSDEELAEAIACSWQVVSLGPRTLRVETAALMLAAWAASG